jgi:hypothetical protein
MAISFADITKGLGKKKEEPGKKPFAFPGKGATAIKVEVKSKAKPFGGKESPEEEEAEHGEKAHYSKIGKPEGENCTLCEYYTGSGCKVTDVVYGDAEKAWCLLYEGKEGDSDDAGEDSELA